MDTLINSAIISFHNYDKRRKNIKELLLDLKYNNNIVQKLTVTFSRKNRIYEKDIFELMTNDIKNNVSNPNITQFFMDCIYYAIPNNNNDFLLLIILGFDSIERKTKFIIYRPYKK